MKLNNGEIDKLIEESKKQIEKTSKDIMEEKKNEKHETRSITNEKSKDQVNLGQLGNFKKVTKEEALNVFEHLPTTIFQIHKCLFRISFIQHNKFKFTAELINLEEEKDNTQSS